MKNLDKKSVIEYMASIAKSFGDSEIGSISQIRSSEHNYIIVKGIDIINYEGVELFDVMVIKLPDNRVYIYMVTDITDYDDGISNDDHDRIIKRGIKSGGGYYIASSIENPKNCRIFEINGMSSRFYVVKPLDPDSIFSVNGRYFIKKLEK